jgi:hypothetical protein
MREARPMRRIFSVPLKVLLVIVAIPLAALAALVSSIFGLKAKLSASEVATYLRDFIEGGGGAWDWDDFTSVPIGDPRLEEIRRRAAAIDIPVTGEGSAMLRELLVEADDLARLETAT